MRKKINTPTGKKRLERLKQLQKMCETYGILTLPFTYRELGKKFNVSHTQIANDLNWLIAQAKEQDLDKIFADMTYGVKKALFETRRVLVDPATCYSDKLKAAKTLLEINEGFTRLLETWQKKNKVPDKHEITNVQYKININKPKEMPVYEITQVEQANLEKGGKNEDDKLDTNKETESSSENPEQSDDN